MPPKRKIQKRVGASASKQSAKPSTSGETSEEQELVTKPSAGTKSPQRSPAAKSKTKSPQPSTSGKQQKTPTSLQKRRRPFEERSSDEENSPTSPKQRRSPKSKERTLAKDPSSTEKNTSPKRKSLKTLKKTNGKKQRAAESKKMWKARPTEVHIGTKTFQISSKTAQDIARLQRTTHLLIPRRPFAKLVREVLQDNGFSRDHRIQYEALEAIQTAGEIYLVQLFEDSVALSMHARRITCTPRDMQLVLYLRRPS